MIKTKLQAFFKDTSGAVTLPWIIIGGGIVLLGAATTAMMETSSEGLQEDNCSFFESMDNTNGDSYDC